MRYRSQGIFAQLNGMGGPDDDDSAPSPAHSGIPLVEGGNPAWNKFLEHVPDDKRAEVVPVLQEWDKGYQKLSQEHAPFRKLGANPEELEMALNVKRVIENQPQVVYETLGKHLGISTQQAQELVEESGETHQQVQDDQRLEALQQQVQTMAQILMKSHESELKEQQTKEQDQVLDAELKSLREEKGDFPEKEILMRMGYLDMSAEQAYDDYMGHVQEVRKSRPAPWVLGGSGSVPRPTVDATKLSEKDTKATVAQILQHFNAESRS